MAGNKLGRDGLSSLWTRIYNLIKLITGDVEVTSKGTLQAQINNIKTFVKSGSSAAGGLVPKPPTTAGTTKYLREDGTWQVPPDTNTTYSNMTAATASAAGKAGLVPAPAAGAQAKFLRGDGTWQTPTDTDTKNTAGTTNKTATKMYLAGATSQAANPVTYSNSNCYIGTDNELYSAGKKVAHQEDVDTLNSNLILPYGNDGKIINRLKAFVSNIAIPYLDGATLFTTVNLQNLFSDKSSMIAVVTMYGDYNVSRCNIVANITSTNTVDVIVRADDTTTFPSGTVLYASLLIIGK